MVSKKDFWGKSDVIVGGGGEREREEVGSKSLRNGLEIGFEIQISRD